MSVKEEIAEKIEGLSEEIARKFPKSYERDQATSKLDDVAEDVRGIRTKDGASTPESETEE
jgi:hypothetical protein